MNLSPTRELVWCASVLVTIACVDARGFAEPAAGISDTVDLFADGDTWTTWSPRAEIAPQFKRELGAPHKPTLVVESTGLPSIVGCWRRSLPRLEAGRRYRVEVAFSANPELNAAHCVQAVITRRKKWFQELELDGGIIHNSGDLGGRFSIELAPTKDLDNLSLRLFLAWTPDGRVRWSDARLSDITNQQVKPRNVRLAAVSGGPGRGQDPIEFYVQRLKEVGRSGTDLVCLPEVINDDPEPIPGPSTKQLSRQARAHNMYVAASLRERDEDAVYNTGVLIDREGHIVGKYRKTHLANGEGLLGGTAPGNSYPVFNTDFGRVAYMICYDYHFPEVPRILAVQGAEVLVFSNAGDGREGGSLWESCIRTRALDNNVHIVASVNSGRSCIVSPRGEILSIVDRTPGAIAAAECDLDVSVANFSGRSIGNRYQRRRRNDTYEALLKHSWDAPAGSRSAPLARQGTPR